MQQTKILLAASIILSLAAMKAEASLTVGTAGGKSVVYDNITNITWTRDANLLGTLESKLGFSTVVSAIIAVSPTISDTPNFFDTPKNSGHYNVTSADFGSNGMVNWFGAQAFTNYLNAINYAGSNQWALPTAGTKPQYGYNQTNTQFGELYYNELNALAYPGTNGSGSDWGIFNSGHIEPFTNLQSYLYWLGTEITTEPSATWVFRTSHGDQIGNYKGNQLYAWAVSPGNVAAVPVPPSVWLFGSGLMGLVGWRRRSNIRFFG